MLLLAPSVVEAIAIFNTFNSHALAGTLNSKVIVGGSVAVENTIYLSYVCKELYGNRYSHALHLGYHTNR